MGSSCAATDTWNTATAYAAAHYTATAAYCMSNPSNCMDLHQNSMIESNPSNQSLEPSYLIDNNSADIRSISASTNHLTPESSSGLALNNSRLSMLSSKCEVGANTTIASELSASQTICKSGIFPILTLLGNSSAIPHNICLEQMQLKLVLHSQPRHIRTQVTLTPVI